MTWSKLTSMTKCVDGVCRKKCEIPYSSCENSKPLRCTDGRCVRLLSECVSIKCKADTPFLCPDGSCKGTLYHCRYPSNIRVIQTQSLTTPEEYMPKKLTNQSSVMVGMIITQDQIHLRYKGVAMSVLEKTKLSIDPVYEPLFLMFFSKELDALEPREFIRSSVISVNTNTQDSRIKYKKPIFLHMNTDIMKVPSKFHRIPKYVS